VKLTVHIIQQRIFSVVSNSSSNKNLSNNSNNSNDTDVDDHICSCGEDSFVLLRMVTQQILSGVSYTSVAVMIIYHPITNNCFPLQSLIVFLKNAHHIHLSHSSISRPHVRVICEISAILTVCSMSMSWFSTESINDSSHLSL